MERGGGGERGRGREWEAYSAHTFHTPIRGDSSVNIPIHLYITDAGTSILKPPVSKKDPVEGGEGGRGWKTLYIPWMKRRSECLI